MALPRGYYEFYIVLRESSLALTPNKAIFSSVSNLYSHHSTNVFKQNKNSCTEKPLE